ncbi:YtpR family tRNA-binding protein [Caminibacter mediatlanticus]|uniref:Phenylalanine--tRNA ligase beta subunit n=1 Tax=Caminibacter mediatlanticus TB-2 TaxID=391592 RepID=A0AAI9AIH4_9BACT|nr:phenylalanine--tRNA ligase subunit beta [Caminibacter mediatlanticus]EDM24150.1 phenylalanyl-tRNA synthetase beta subunit [Caminibacter mediatlanticus TB-2]
MIVTRKWLEEFIDLSDISTEIIIDTLNRIGQEVEGYKKIEIPQNVVIGEVVECEKHPNADKLNLCKVNVGDEVLQIVCGASNVEAGQFVVVAKIGAILPGGFKIKKAKLRGIESFGMICAAREVGLPDFHDGILVLDNSLGELKIGEYAGIYFNDEIIELGVTANRGDCFSIKGIARELSAGLNKDLKNFDFSFEEMPEGIGRVVNIIKNEAKKSSHYIRAFEGKINRKLKIDYRLALVEVESKDVFDSYIKYSMHATGVLLVGGNIGEIELENENGIDIFKCYGKYLVGIRNEINIEENKKYIINANYIDPKYVSEVVFLNNLKTDEYFYRASRGSDTNLKFGANYFLNEINLPLFSGDIDLQIELKEKIINVNIEEINEIIGFEIEEKEIVEILKKLSFEIVNIDDENIKVKIPLFRSDIENIQDIAEEVLRVYGIDKIPNRPLEFVEKDRTNKTIENIDFIREIKLKSVSNGFYEAIHFVFDNKERLQKYGFEVLDDNLDLLNPIANELNTLRTTLLLQLLDDIKFNKANGYKRIYLFSQGSVYNKKREEFRKIAFVVNGFADYENPKNHGKPNKVDFKFIVDKLSQVVGDFELVENDYHPIAHPYQNAKIIKDGKNIGVVAKLHPKIAKDFDIDDTYFAEINLDILSKEKKEAKDIIKFPKVTRDLSLVVDKNISYLEVKKIIDNLNIKELREFYPIDIYDLGDNNSLTIRFIIQANKTLQENEINDIMEKILKSLEEKGIKLR